MPKLGQDGDDPFNRMAKGVEERCAQAAAIP